ncbi:hypothetical protein OROGR_010741 [Orobanche gracilis]
MGEKSWSFTAKPCDSCSVAPGAVFCRADSAFFCASCDAGIHAADAAASPHARVPVCDVCEQAPAAVTCKADSAALCRACDAGIHSANPLAARHERLPVVPFYDAVSVAKSSASASAPAEEFSEEEAEAASWLLPDPNNKFEGESGSPEYKPTEYLFGELDPYLDLVLVPGKQKSGHDVNEEKLYASDGVVPVQHGSDLYPGTVMDGLPAYDVGYPGSKPLIMYNFTSQSISQSISSSSLDMSVVPDHITMADISNTFSKNDDNAIPTRLSGVEREARVLRYREKRKNRKFEKTIRYASRKAYAETRPRIQGRFAKRPKHGVSVVDTSYGVVPTF